MLHIISTNSKFINLTIAVIPPKGWLAIVIPTRS